MPFAAEENELLIGGKRHGVNTPDVGQTFARCASLISVCPTASRLHPRWAKTPSRDKMRTGNFSLQSLFDYVKTVPRLPKRDKLEWSVYGHYQQAGLDLIKNVPNLPGWYLWARPKGPRPEVYVGKSEEGLNNRFINRFNQEYTIFWEAVWGEHPFLEDAYEMFPQPRYRKDIDNYRGKSISTDILWVAKNSLEPDEGEQVERLLIRDLNPSANLRRPKPDGRFQQIAAEVADLFRQRLNSYIK